MRHVYIDTETTGKWDFKAEETAEHQPYMLQVAAILDMGPKLLEYKTEVLIPKDVEISKEAEGIHGITRAMLNQNGVPSHKVLMMLSGMIHHSDVIVCHNTSFDIRVIKACYHRAELPYSIIELKNIFCTMRESTNICKLPGKYGYKWPTLDEAYRILVDPKGFEGAHDALADVRACRKVHIALMKMEEDKRTNLSQH